MSNGFKLNCREWPHEWLTPSTPEQHAILAAHQADGMKSHGAPGSHDGTNDGSGMGWAPAGTPTPVPMTFAVDAVPSMDEILAACGEELQKRYGLAKNPAAKPAPVAKPKRPAKSKSCRVCGEADKRDCGCAPARHWWN